ncbi:hypothetical protein JGS39_31515 [Streptomyces sp. P01-B04]|uniref:hypothetical protein n=1 Tax=Streptomyces poriferorum TaxID=2798799 RepID=UPI001C5FB5C6|nr:hypothetical protein [Streptomyces poriferorum]MBW5253449.1 hypothetical protein [Streptomyces poriferorum]
MPSSQASTAPASTPSVPAGEHSATRRAATSAVPPPASQVAATVRVEAALPRDARPAMRSRWGVAGGCGPPGSGSGNG